MENPKLTLRLALLGFAGSEEDAARIERRIEAAWTSHDNTNLAAMIAADLELRGPSRVGWVEAMYFADRCADDAGNRGRLACAQCSRRRESYRVP